MWACRYVGMYVGSYGLRGHVTCGHVGMWVCTGMTFRNIGIGFFFFLPLFCFRKAWICDICCCFTVQYSRICTSANA